MKHPFALLLLFLFLALGASVETRASISVEIQFGAVDAPAGALGVLVADTGNNGFESPSLTTGVPLAVGSILGSDDVVVATFANPNLPEWAARRGFAEHSAALDYTDLGVEEGQALLLYIFPDRALGDPVRTGEPHVSYRTEDPTQFTPNSSMGFSLPADGGAYLLALVDSGLGGTADLASVDIAEAVLNGGSGQIGRVLGATERHTYYFEADADGFLSVSGGGAGLIAELYHRDGQLIASNDGTAPFFFEQDLEAGFHTLVVYHAPGGGGPSSYELQFDPDYVRFVHPDVALGASLSRLVASGTSFAPGSSVVLTSKKAIRVSGHATVANLGERPESLAVRASRGNAFFKVRYVGAGGNITGALLRGTHRTSVLDANTAADRLRADIIPNKRKLRKSVGTRVTYLRKSMSTLIYANSTSDPSRYDGGWFRVRIR